LRFPAAVAALVMTGGIGAPATVVAVKALSSCQLTELESVSLIS